MLKGEDVKRIVANFEATGAVHDRKSTGRPKTATDENTSISVSAAIEVNPHSNLRELSMGCGKSTRRPLHSQGEQMETFQTASAPRAARWRRREKHSFYLGNNGPNRESEQPQLCSEHCLQRRSVSFFNNLFNRQNYRYW
jgi:hypothetical protein